MLPFNEKKNMLVNLYATPFKHANEEIIMKHSSFGLVNKMKKDGCCD